MKIEDSGTRIAQVAADLAEEVGSSDANREDIAKIIKSCAEAVGALYGANGGEMRYRYLAEYHYVTHEGEKRPRFPATGFVPTEDQA